MRLRVLTDDNDQSKLITVFADRPSESKTLEKVLKAIHDILGYDDSDSDKPGEKDGKSDTPIDDGNTGTRGAD